MKYTKTVGEIMKTIEQRRRNGMDYSEGFENHVKALENEGFAPEVSKQMTLKLIEFTNQLSVR